MQQYLTNFLTGISTHLTGALGAIVVLCIGLIVADLVRGLVVRVVNGSGLTQKLCAKWCACANSPPTNAVNKKSY